MRPFCLVIALCAATTISSPGQTFTDLADFDSTNGANPYSSLTQGLDGNFYGTTEYGGANNGGTVFKVTPTGTITALYSFCSLANCADGEYPGTALVLAENGNFYGTTQYGGVNCAIISDCSTIFEITPAGKLTTLYTFCSTNSDCPDGAYPNTLVHATDGNFYGTTYEGGTYGGGTVFKMTPKGALTTLYNFCAQTNCTDGELPDAGLIQATNGKFYGTTFEGGQCPPYYVCGTVFEITAAGKFASLYSFCRKCNAGDEPQAPLVQAADGTLFGTSASVVFKMTPKGKLTTLAADGDLPWGGLIQATDVNLYGTTYEGGTNGKGTIFQITPTGKLTTLYSFCSQTNCADGYNPTGGLLQATDGNFYGMTPYGGTYTCSFSECGNIFRLSIGLGPFVTTVPKSAKVDAKVIILGNKLKGTTSVTFNGTAAKFTAVSNSEIKTNVPKDATTGYVKVTTPKGTLKTNVVFRVTK